MGAKVRLQRYSDIELVLTSMKVYMAVPDEERTREALKRVEREGRDPGLGQVIWHELDLKDPRTAKSSAQRFIEKEQRLDILSTFRIFQIQCNAD